MGKVYGLVGGCADGGTWLTYPLLCIATAGVPRAYYDEQGIGASWRVQRPAREHDTLSTSLRVTAAGVRLQPAT